MGLGWVKGIYAGSCRKLGVVWDVLYLRNMAVSEAIIPSNFIRMSLESEPDGSRSSQLAGKVRKCWTPNVMGHVWIVSKKNEKVPKAKRLHKCGVFPPFILDYFLYKPWDFMGFPIFLLVYPRVMYLGGWFSRFFLVRSAFKNRQNAREPFRNAPDRPSTSRRVEARCNYAHICIIYDNICQYVYMILIKTYYIYTYIHTYMLYI